MLCRVVFRLKVTREEQRGEINCVKRAFVILHSSLVIIRMIKSCEVRWGGHVARVGYVVIQYELSGKLKEEITLWALRCKWDNDIEVDHKHVFNTP